MYPTNAEIESIFGELSKVPSGYIAFFNHVDEDVEWEITGQNSLSGRWTSKSEFMNNVWLPIIKLIAEPGPILELASAEKIMRNDDGWVVIELKTKETWTKVGHRLYNQHYCWHCRFNDTKRIVQVKAFIDSSTAETILSDEKFRQQALQDLPTYAALETSRTVPNYPAIPFDPAFKHFLDLFYLLTDQPSETERYVQCFTPDALVLIGSKAIRGRQAIGAMRKSMWNTVKQRTHHAEQVYPHGAYSNVAMVHGTVDYVFNDDSKKTIDWAARCDLVKLDQVYLERYQVYLADDVAWNSKRSA